MPVGPALPFVRLARGVALVLLGGIAVLAATSSGEPHDSVLGRRIANFVLPDASGKQVGLADFKDSKALVIVFLGTKCPVANAYVPFLLDLQKQYRRNVQVLGINPSSGETAADVAAHMKEFGITFPILLDSRQTTLSLFGASRTPEVFLLDARWAIRYHGRIDDRFAPGIQRDEPSRHDLREALDELLGGKKISVPRTEAAGCRITRLFRRKKGEVSYAEHVAPILQRRCVECHRAGTAAPFSLLTFEGASTWSEMIADVVAQRRMPPWHADPRFGRFANERRLTPEEIDTLIAWAEDGAPAGDKKAPPPPTFAGGWRIGTPDVVFKAPEEVTVPAKGKVEYKYFTSPTNFKEDMWVQAAQPRPGNPVVVHHLIVGYKDTKLPPVAQQLMWIAAATAGGDPVVFPEGLGRKVPAGAQLFWELHYQATGKEEKDRSELGLVFCKGRPHHDVQTYGISNTGLRLPPGTGNVRVAAEVPVVRDAVLLSLFPHMHLRGKDFEYQVISPTGRREVLLSVPHYDTNWQHTYRLERPLRVPRGSKIRCVAHFDNSADNPANPDPKKEVRWGRQSWDEMMTGYIDYYWDDVPAGSGP
jgi:peroxiredoxin